MRSKNAIKNVISTLLLQIVSIIVGLIIPVCLIKKYGSNVYGLTVSITQFLLYISLLESGFGPVVKSLLYKPIAKKNKQEIINILKSSETFFKKISYIFIGYIATLCIIYPLIVIKQFDFIFTLSLIVIISISTFFEYYLGMVYKLYLKAEQKSYIIFNIQTLTYILNTIAIFILVKLNCSIQMVKLVSSLIFIIRPITVNIYVKKKYNINLNKNNNNYNIKQKWDGLAQHIAATINNNTDMVILTLFSSILNVAIYSIYYLITNGIKSLVYSLSTSLDATFGDMIAKKETQNLNKKFCIYEFMYYTFITIVYICTLILIIPFIILYTSNIADANYIVPLFGLLIVIATFANSIRLPYASLTLAAGHFKETRVGAWFEAGTNLILSIILVKKYGLVGVAIGTLVAMLIRTIEFMHHASKYILNRTLWYTYKRIFIIAGEILLVFLISKLLPVFTINNYFDWVIYAIIIFVISTIIVLPINSLFYKQEFKDTINLIKNLFKRKRVKN